MSTAKAVLSAILTALSVAVALPPEVRQFFMRFLFCILYMLPCIVKEMRHKI